MNKRPVLGSCEGAMNVDFWVWSTGPRVDAEVIAEADYPCYRAD